MSLPFPWLSACDVNESGYIEDPPMVLEGPHCPGGPLWPPKIVVRSPENWFSLQLVILNSCDFNQSAMTMVQRQ